MELSVVVPVYNEEANVEPLSGAGLRALQAALGANVEIIAEPPAMPSSSIGHLVVHDLMQLLARHPATIEDLSASLNCKHEIIQMVLNALMESGVIEVREHRGKKFYAATISPASEKRTGFLETASV